MGEDTQLIRRMKNGDEAAIDEFVRKYYPQILQYCRLHSPDLCSAEDMTQETFLRFFRTLPNYQHYGKAANYLYVIAGNCCRDDWRRVKPLSLEEIPEPFGEDWVNEQGESETGFAAIAKLRAAKKEWAGVLDEEKLQAVIRENQRIIATPEAQSKDYQQNDIAYSWKQGIGEILYMLKCSFADGFRSFDHNTANRLVPEQAKDFYPNRVKLLKEWLYDPTDSAYNRFSDDEKAFLISQYESLETPITYDYATGWEQALTYTTTITMLCALILGYLMAGIFSNEFKWHSDSIFFSTINGRNQAVWAKIKAGFLLVTAVYWVSILTFSLLTLSYLGFDGWNCPIQIFRWKCFYNITCGQYYLLVLVGGYVGNLFTSFLVMWISAKTRSSLFAVTIPYVIVFLPSFIPEFVNTTYVGKILALLPDRLLDTGMSASYFDLLSFGKKVVGAFPVCLLLYFILSLILVPAMYRAYRHKQIT